MTEPTINAGKPIICTFRQLAYITYPLHQNDKHWLASLHDIYMLGAPTPNSIIRNPKGYDPRVSQQGNYEARIVFPTALSKWVVECIKERGFAISIESAFRMLDQAFALGMSHIDYEVPKSTRIQVTK